MPPNTQHIGIIDAGSTSSRLLIFSYDHDIVATRRYTAPLKFKKVCEKDEKGGTSIGVVPDGNLALMTDHLRPLLDGCLDKLPRNLQRTVPLYVMATAGMRGDDGEPLAGSQAKMRLAWDAIHGLQQGDDDNEAVRRRVYYNGRLFNLAIPDNQEVNDIRDAHSFVVPQDEEGIYAWIALNHGLDRSGTWMPGIIELGGKSMQVAYERRGGTAVCLWNSRYPVESHSWVLGAETSRLAVETTLAGSTSPCLPYPQHGKYPGNRNVVGNGNFEECLATVKSYFAYGTFGDDNTDIPNPRLDLQHLANRFYGFSTFWYTYEFFAQFEVYSIDSPYDAQLFRQAVEKYCTGSQWFPNGQKGPAKFMQNHCFAGAWMITLFHDYNGFQLQSSSRAWKDLIHFPTTEELQDRSSWTIGAAVVFARQGNVKDFCRGTEVGNGEYPPGVHPAAPALPPGVPAAPGGITLVSTPFVVEPAQLVRAPSIPTAIAGSLLPSLPFDQLNPGSTFSVGLVSGVLLIALVLIGYQRFSACRVQLPVCDDKNAAQVNEQPVAVRARLTFDKTKGAIFLAGEDNISYV